MRLINYRYLYFWRRYIRCAICSMGGVGSTALARHVGSISDKTAIEHAPHPDAYDTFKPLKLGYVFGNPYNSVLSVFRRGYQQMVADSMRQRHGSAAISLRQMSVEEYLERGIDEFGLEAQFDAWTSKDAAKKHPVICIKYETLSETIDEVLAYFECKRPFNVKPRKTDWREQPVPIVSGLERMYGSLYEKIAAAPALKTMNPTH